ncbi:Lysosomal aspartic protease [Geodia barretti]|uniref:Lysosomal aspartic protease n=1 Tax=Geodia barretti TaxID=519541 RepID=A0AA35T8C4_GEOBA|nr:Lysosomal aspartic protease [Geodia barretti]
MSLVKKAGSCARRQDPTILRGTSTYVPLQQRDLREFKMDSILVGGKKSNYCENCNAIADTGTSLLAGPADMVTELNKQLGAFEIPIVHEWVFTCDELSKLPNVAFVLNGDTFELTPNEYVLKVRRKKRQSFPFSSSFSIFRYKRELNRYVLVDS